MILPNHPIQHILCDLDGTLIDSGGLRVQFEFIGRTLPLMKKHQGWKTAYRCLIEAQEILKRPSRVKTNAERVIDVYAKRLKLPHSEAEKELMGVLHTVFPKLKSHFGKIEGAAKFVDWAKDYFTLTLATNPVWSKDIVHMRMKWGGIDPDYFRSITTADRMHACKPTKDYYEELLEQEDFNAKHCLMIGNERKMDLPAVKAGINVFLIRPEAEQLRCLVHPSVAPGVWRGNYTHLREWLTSHLMERLKQSPT